MLNQWLNGVLGLMVVIVPFLTLSDTALTWTLVIVGLVIAFSSFWAMVTEPNHRRSTHGTRVNV
jgi:hypothetical protein